MSRTDLVAIAASGVLFTYIVEAVRRRRLREEYSILWILTASVLFTLSLARPALNVFAWALGIYYPPSALFVIGFAFTILILLHFSMVVSQLKQENRELAQRFALLVRRLEEYEEFQQLGSDQANNRSRKNTKDKTCISAETPTEE